MRATTGRCLLLLVPLCLLAQASALVVHAPIAIAADTPSEGERRGEHAPDTCDLCQTLSQVRVEAPPAGILIVPLVAFTQSVLPSALGSLEAAPKLSASSPRAPPANSLS